VLVVVAGSAAVIVHAAQPAWWLRLWYPLDHQATITGYAAKYRLDPALVAAVIYKESRFRDDARSDAGAIGLMQLLPDTAQGIATHTGGTAFDPQTDLLNPDLNVRYGCWYLRHLMDKYGRYANAEQLALAAYNAGQANVDRWITRTPAGGNVPIPFPETRDYVDSIEHLQDVYAKAYGAELGEDGRRAAGSPSAEAPTIGR
jgi:soluble lytic murein transglycosylase